MIVAMVYHGHIRDGRVEIEDAARLPEGAAVRVEVLDRQGHDSARERREAIERIRALSQGCRLNGVSVRDLIDEGRRF